MLPQADPKLFGRAIEERRKSKGLGRKEVVERISNHYSDVGTYGRVERGERKPDRTDAIAILVHGLQMTDTELVNSLLSLAGYEGLTAAEAEHCKLTLPVPTSDHKPNPEKYRAQGFWERAANLRRARALAVIFPAASLALAFVISSIAGAQVWFWMVAATMYAGLYVISLFLESAFEDRLPRILSSSVFVFCFMLLTTVIALATDFQCVKAGKQYGLLLSLPILCAAASVQWWFVRTALPDRTVVKTSFQSHTAQAAHLKNTFYFLLTVIAFLAFPIDCIQVLRRYVDLGELPRARELSSHWLVIAGGAFSLNPEGLTIVTGLLILISIPMRSQLLDNLKPGPKVNSYTNWFYARGVLYFAMCLLCLVWYAIQVASLRT